LPHVDEGGTLDRNHLKDAVHSLRRGIQDGSADGPSDGATSSHSGAVAVAALRGAAESAGGAEVESERGDGVLLKGGCTTVDSESPIAELTHTAVRGIAGQLSNEDGVAATSSQPQAVVPARRPVARSIDDDVVGHSLASTANRDTASILFQGIAEHAQADCSAMLDNVDIGTSRENSVDSHSGPAAAAVADQMVAREARIACDAASKSLLALEIDGGARSCSSVRAASKPGGREEGAAPWPRPPEAEGGGRCGSALSSIRPAAESEDPGDTSLAETPTMSPQVQCSRCGGITEADAKSSHHDGPDSGPDAAAAPRPLAGAAPPPRLHSSASSSGAGAGRAEEVPCNSPTPPPWRCCCF